MERLTIKNSDGTHSQVTETKFIQFFDKVAEFEDFMEQEEFTSIEDLKAYIKLQSKGSSDLIQENKALKYRWQKLKEFVITNRNSMFLNDMPTARMYLKKVLDKMQELEKEIK